MHATPALGGAASGARHSAEAKWTEALKRPKQLVASWLKEVAGVEEPMAIGDPAISQGNVLTARVMVRTLDRDKCLRASGKGGGVFCRPWRTKGPDGGFAQDGEFKDVPINREQGLDSALRTLEGESSVAWGLVPFGPGYAARVKAADYTATLDRLQSTADNCRFTDARYEIRGLPLSWGKLEVAAFFAGKWEMTPIWSTRKGFGRTWLVGAAAPPLSKRWQHDFGLAVVSDYERKPQLHEIKRWQPTRKSSNDKSPTPVKPSAAGGAWAKTLTHGQRPAAAAAVATPPAAAAQPAAAKEVSPPADFMVQVEKMVAAAAAAAVKAAIAPLAQEMRAMKEAINNVEEEEEESEMGSDMDEDTVQEHPETAQRLRIRRRASTPAEGEEERRKQKK